MIDKLPSVELDQAREGRFYQALIAELNQRRAVAVQAIVNLASGAENAPRLYALGGRAACLEDLLRFLETARGRDE